MHHGIIVFYLPERGYGYLRLAGTREEFHFRKQHLAAGEVAAGDAVTFRLREGKTGYYADEVRRANLA